MKKALKYNLLILISLVISGFSSSLLASGKVYGAQGFLPFDDFLLEDNWRTRITTLAKNLELRDELKKEPRKVSTCTIDIPALNPLDHLPSQEERELAERLYGLAKLLQHGSRDFPQNVDRAIRLYHRACEYGHWCACEKMADIFEKGLFGVKRDHKRGQDYIERNPALELWDKAEDRERHHDIMAKIKAMEAKEAEERGLKEEKLKQAVVAASTPVVHEADTSEGIGSITYGVITVPDDTIFGSLNTTSSISTATTSEDIDLEVDETHPLLALPPAQKPPADFELRQRHKTTGRDRAWSLEAR